MSIINNGLLLASGADAAVGYQISRSLRFDAASTSYLSRTPGSAGTRTTYTLSVWVKRAALSTRQMIFSANNGGDSDAIYFHEDNTLRFFQRDGLDSSLITTQVFRDASAWYHIVLAVDTTQGTGSNRVKIYVNGTQVTTFSTASYPSSSYTGGINNTVAHNIGRRSSASDNYLDAYLADAWFLDGTATTPSTFAETDAVTGQWVPKTPTGISYGTNGFHLTFSDNSGTTSTTLGNDVAGSNDFTPNNFSVASGAGNDSLVDSPTSYGTDTGAGGEVRGNYATLNPLNSGGATLANGNLESSSTSNQAPATTIGIGPAVKSYWEVTLSSLGSGNTWIGVRSTQVNVLVKLLGSDSGQLFVQDVSGGNGGDSTTSGWAASSYSANDVLGIGLDVSASTFTFYKNGVLQNTYTNSKLNVNGVYFPTYYGSAGTATGLWNFGQRAFAYTAPSGFKALCDTNLTAPTIALPNTVMGIVLWNGDSTSPRTISGLSFAPDLVWLKRRVTNGSSHYFVDSVRGDNSGVMRTLFSDKTDAEESTNSATNLRYGYVSALTSTGFTVAAGSDASLPLAGVNDSNYPSHVAWAWDAGSSNATNTSGTITSTVRANATAGFSVITYTGNGGTNATVGHGLGVAPQLVIGKWRGGSSDWEVYHKSAGATKVLQLNTTGAAGTLGHFGSTDPTSTLITVNASGTYNEINGNGQTYVLYAFAPVAGYSAFGSYTGNGSADGPFVFTGHRSRWILIKDTGSGNWRIYDTARDSYNQATAKLYPNSSTSENAVSGESASTNTLDLLSNGFKLRTSNSETNFNGNTYIWASFAENPFQYARAR